jgi:hypothetical protein
LLQQKQKAILYMMGMGSPETAARLMTPTMCAQDVLAASRIIYDSIKLGAILLST